MAILTVIAQGRCTDVPFSGTPVLSCVLQAHGWQMAHPCGGRGVCGKCAVKLTGHVSVPNPAEQRAGCRLSCQAVLLGDCTVTLTDAEMPMQVELGGGETLAPWQGDSRIGAALDIGTTTLALRVFDLTDGSSIAEGGCVNPQTTAAADVVGRIDAALHGQGELLRDKVQSALRTLLTEHSPRWPERLVVTGNTTMLYLLTGRDPTCLSRAPFDPDCRFDCEETLLGVPVYHPPCLGAFVGADLSCAILSSGLCDRSETALLCDVGTNGEMALWHAGRLYVTSTAAGPCFEGAGISCGCGSAPGAVDRVWVEGNRLGYRVMGGGRARGLCGSGLLDAMAALGQLGQLDDTGLLDTSPVTIAEENVVLTQADVRVVQLAKAAIAAGMATLMAAASVTAEDIAALYLAGGFGSHLNVQSALAIGLIPAVPTSRVHVLGNAALSGAGCLLTNPAQREHLRAVLSSAEVIALGGSADFERRFIASMNFSFGSEEA